MKNSTERSLLIVKKNTNISNISNYELSNTYFVGKEGSGKNVKSNLTPVKRNLLVNKQVLKLVPVFDNTRVLPAVSPGEGVTEESPAKKLFALVRPIVSHIAFVSRRGLGFCSPRF